MSIRVLTTACSGRHDARRRCRAFLRAPRQKTTDAGLRRAVSSLEPSAVSEPVRAADGYHEIRLIRRIPAVRRSLDKVLEEIPLGLRESLGENGSEPMALSEKEL